MTADVDGRPLAQKVASSAMGMAVRRVMITLLSGLSTAIIARVLGPAEYGEFASAIATWTLILAAADFGFTLALGRDLATAVEDRGALIRAAFQIQGAMSVALALMLALLAILTAWGTPRGEAMLALAPSVLFAGFGAARQVFTVLYRQGTVVLIDLGVNAVQVALMVIASAVGWGAGGVAAAVALGFSVSNVLVAIAALRLVDGRRATAAHRRALLHSVLPLGVMAFLTKAYLLVDLVLLGWLVTGASLGEYAAASKMLVLLTTLPGLVVGAALPAFSSQAASRDDLDQIVTRVWHWLMVTAIPLFLGAALFANLAVTVTVGSSYHGSDALLQILTGAGILGVAANFFGIILVAKRIVRPLLYQNVIALTVNVAGNLLLVPRFGVTASAWLTLTSEAIVCGGALVLLRHHLHFRMLLEVSLRPLGALGALTLVGVALADLPVVGAIAAAVAFIVALTALRGWPPELLPARIAHRIA